MVERSAYGQAYSNGATAMYWPDAEVALLEDNPLGKRDGGKGLSAGDGIPNRPALDLDEVAAARSRIYTVKM